MEDFLADLRNDHSDFDLGKLEEVVGNNPFDVFNQWMKNAVETKQTEANSCVISTVNSEGQPSSRVVYLKEVLEQQFIFYTNYNSQKGKDITNNNNVSMLFFWPMLQQQIRIEGVCVKVDEKISDAYFQSRPRSSQIGAWASAQSDALTSRLELENKIIEYSQKYTTNVPRPPHWGGYGIIPNKIEFWQGRPSRLHDRFVFEKEKNEWSIKRLNP